MDAVIREGNLRTFTSESSCDVVLSCQGGRLFAHKVILSIASPFLHELLVLDLTESSVLIFPDIASTTMSLILEYIYNGSIKINSNNIKDFQDVANVLKIYIDFNYIQDTIIRKISDKWEPILSKTNKKKMPNLVPIVEMKSNYKKRLPSCVIPSPWGTRGMSVLSDPRILQPTPIDSYKMELNDPNNNLQYNFGYPPPSSELNRFELDLTTSLINRNLPQINVNNSKNTHINASFAKIKSEHYDEKISCTIISQADGNKDRMLGVKSKCLRVEPSGQRESAKDEVKIFVDDSGKQKPFKCDDCGKRFSQLRNYKYHRSVHEGTKEFAAECPECGKTFNDKGYLSSHMKIHRDRKEYACPHCPKRFNQRVAYNMHLRIHTGVKPHECQTCGKSFSRKMLLKQHQRVHTGERPYTCPECGKTFADRSNMSLHTRLHTGVKPYTCSLCPKSFTKKHHLKTHMNFHTGLKPYTCENCGLAFSQSSNMRTHYKKCVLKKKSGTSVDKDPVYVDSSSSDSK